MNSVVNGLMFHCRGTTVAVCYVYDQPEYDNNIFTVLLETMNFEILVDSLMLSVQLASVSSLSEDAQRIFIVFYTGILQLITRSLCYCHDCDRYLHCMLGINRIVCLKVLEQNLKGNQ